MNHELMLHVLRYTETSGIKSPMVVLQSIPIPTYIFSIEVGMDYIRERNII